jgi:microcystin-dependent protein
MADPYLSEIRIMGFAFAPKGWAFCNGQILSIQQNNALFALLGTTFGGNGTTTFALPNLQGRVPLHMGPGFTIGQLAGTITHTLTTQETPQHNHLAKGTPTTGTSAIPTGNVLGGAAGVYTAAGDLVALPAASLASQGGNQQHDNMQPYLALNFCIALVGIFPSRN